jgi:hypothetical protein
LAENIFFQHPDQKEGQGLAIFHRGISTLKIVGKFQNFGGTSVTS